MSYFYKVEEMTGRSHYMVLDGIYDTREEANNWISRQPSNQNMRAVLYRTGDTRGPIRVES